MQRVIQPKILYFGTPVVIISTLNADGTTNLAPMSSAWWLDQSCMLGMSSRSQTMHNVLRERTCVLNLPSVAQVAAVNRLALLTGRNPVPDYKVAMGYRYEADKFGVAGLTPVPSESGGPARVAECPIQLEATLVDARPFGEVDDALLAAELRIVCTHVDEALLVPGTTSHIDPDAWKPLIMSFTEFYGLGERVHDSRLARVYRPAPAAPVGA
ncbi:MAG: flavin reductase family protein [Ktedonobacterales bacterium]|nr:flavin reductase family protein [Ktedonobacterales bacterium]